MKEHIQIHVHKKTTYLDAGLVHAVPYDHPSACATGLFYQHYLVLEKLIYQSFSLALREKSNTRTIIKLFNINCNPSLINSQHLHQSLSQIFRETDTKYFI